MTTEEQAQFRIEACNAYERGEIQLTHDCGWSAWIDHDQTLAELTAWADEHREVCR